MYYMFICYGKYWLKYVSILHVHIRIPSQIGTDFVSIPQYMYKDVFRPEDLFSQYSPHKQLSHRYTLSSFSMYSSTQKESLDACMVLLMLWVKIIGGSCLNSYILKFQIFLFKSCLTVIRLICIVHYGVILKVSIHRLFYDQMQTYLLWCSK